MRVGKRHRSRLLAGSAMTAAVLAGAPAWAQDAPPSDPREARIEQLEDEIQALAAQVADLKAQASAEVRAVRADAPARTAPAPCEGHRVGRISTTSGSPCRRAAQRL